MPIVLMPIRILLGTLLMLRLLSAAQPSERSFYLGFTPFPYAVSVEAVQYTYQTIARDADLIAHHFDNGVPWVEALRGEPYRPAVLDDWSWRRAQTPPGHKRYVSVAPINLWRNGLALYRGDGEDMPLPPPWDGYDFNHPDVKAAFLNYCLEIIAYFEPDYFNMGIEVNGLLNNAPDRWEAYLELHRHVYEGIKRQYPELPVFVSLLAMDLLDEATDTDHAAHLEAVRQLGPYTDLFALSIYPYMSAYMTGPLPADLFDRLASLSDKPMAIAETGYPAETFAVPVNSALLTFETDADRQARYIQQLLDAAQQHDFVFVINFVLRDYDALLEAVAAPSVAQLALLWKDTGLYDQDGRSRPALDIWRNWLALPVSR